MTVFVTRTDIGGHGPRVAIKDTIDMAGLPTRAGSRALASAAPATSHAMVVERLIKAGYRIVGKTTMHELAFGTTGINPWAGTPVNPRFPNHVPGGSSSGSAVAVADGLADVALGTDTGGSVRVPAACCEIIGLKPTFDRISREGVLPSSTSLDCVGVFALDMRQLVDCLRAIDPGFGALPAIDGVSISLLQVSARKDIERAVSAVVSASGLPVSDARLDLLDEAYRAGLTIINAESTQAWGSLLDTGLVGADVASRLRLAARVGSEEVTQAEAVRQAFTREVDGLLAQHPILALPTMADAPPLLEEASDTTKLVSMTSLVRPFNLSGHPAISLPIPTNLGFPVALQLVAAHGQDELLCAVAMHVASTIKHPSSTFECNTEVKSC